MNSHFHAFPGKNGARIVFEGNIWTIFLKEMAILKSFFVAFAKSYLVVETFATFSQCVKIVSSDSVVPSALR
jgi:hypothetical protein